jgi:hypothetical protein
LYRNFYKIKNLTVKFSTAGIIITDPVYYFVLSLPFEIFRIQKPSEEVKISNLINYSSVCCRNDKGTTTESKVSEFTHI